MVGRVDSLIKRNATNPEKTKKTKLAIKKFAKNNVGFVYIFPWLIGLLVFQLYPFIASFVYSFTDYSLGSKFNFVGLKNFTRILTVDPDFKNSLKLTFMYVVYSVPMKIAFALIIAMLLNINIRGMNFFRTVYYLPSILGGSVAVSILWMFLFSNDGLINQVLAKLHVSPVNWLTSTGISLFTLGLLSVWQFGSSMVLFLAGLKQIPNELYEAGRVDGASSVRMFFKITLPMLTPIIFFNLVMQTINAFQEMTAPFVITRGGPMKSTYLYAMLLYNNGFLYFKMGYASALSWILFAIILVFTIIVFKTQKYWTFYSDGGEA